MTPVPPTPLTDAQIRAQLDIARGALNQIDQGLATSNTPPPPPPDQTIHVTAGGNLQAAIDIAAKSGQDILVEPGTYSTIMCRGRLAGGRDIRIRPNVDLSQLPAPGVRPTGPSPVIIAPTAGSNVGIGTDKGARGYIFQAIGVSSPSATGTMVSIDGRATVMDDVPDGFTLQSCYLDGGNACKRGVAANGAHVRILDSVITAVMAAGQDTQAIGGATGPGPFLIENNYLSAGGETVFFGGADPQIQGLIPSDITIRRNYITKDLAWRTIKSVAKNCLELKNAQRVLIELNILENSWVDEQTGFGILLTVRNQNGTAPWSTVKDFEIRYNVMRHVNQAFQILAMDDEKSAKTGLVPASVPMQNGKIHHNLVYDIGNPSLGGGTRVAVSISNGPVGLAWDHNTFLGSVGTGLALDLGGAKRVSQGLTFTNSILPEGNYGIKADTLTEGKASWGGLTDAASVFDYNLVIQGTSGRKIVYPGANTKAIPAVPMTLPFTPPASFLTSDGAQVGVDIEMLKAMIPEFDPTK